MTTKTTTKNPKNGVGEDIGWGWGRVGWGKGGGVGWGKGVGWALGPWGGPGEEIGRFRVWGDGLTPVPILPMDPIVDCYGLLWTALTMH